MLFNSFSFLIFFPTVTVLYFLIPHRYRWFFLLMASCVFYVTFIPVYILVLALTIAIGYTAGLLIEENYIHRACAPRLFSILQPMTERRLRGEEA